MNREIADLALIGGKLVLPDGVRNGSVTIRDGLIEKIVFNADKTPTTRNVRDVGGAYVLPGLIDSHVHFRTPGLTHKETWESGSRAAVAGGVTTVIDMPNTAPYFADPRELSARISHAAGRSLVDFAFHLGVTSESIDSLEGVDPTVVPSVKVFLAGHHTAKHILREESDLDRLFRVAARNKLQLTLHAEDQATLDLLTVARGEPQTLGEHERTYARDAAVVSISRVIRLVERYGTQAHILHVSSADEVELLETAIQSGLPITFEITSHHLTFTTEDEQLGAFGKLRPALRTQRDRERLWQAILDGTAATIGSDHAPHTREEKSVVFADAPPGFPGVQELAPAFLSGLREVATHLGPDRHMQLLARLASEMPAKLFGLDDRKGSLVEGRDADVVVLSPTRPWHVSPATIYAHCGWSAYDGRTLFGAAMLTLRRGGVIYDGGTFGEPDGAWLKCRQRDGSRISGM
jgi:dihydroorotase